MTADAHQSVVPQWTLQDKIRKAREYAGLCTCGVRERNVSGERLAELLDEHKRPQAAGM